MLKIHSIGGSICVFIWLSLFQQIFTKQASSHTGNGLKKNCTFAEQRSGTQRLRIEIIIEVKGLVLHEANPGLIFDTTYEIAGPSPFIYTTIPKQRLRSRNQLTSEKERAGQLSQMLSQSALRQNLF